MSKKIKINEHLDAAVEVVPPDVFEANNYSGNTISTFISEPKILVSLTGNSSGTVYKEISVGCKSEKELTSNLNDAFSNVDDYVIHATQMEESYKCAVDAVSRLVDQRPKG